MQSTIYLGLVSLFLLILSGCEGNSKFLTNTVEAAKKGIVEIRLEANGSSPIEVGQTMTFTVNAYDENGNYVETVASDKPEWSVSCSESGCAWINEKGVLTGIGNGEATVTADFASFKASLVVEVSDAKLQSIDIRYVGGEPTAVDFCRSYELEAYGTYSDLTERNITQLATWEVQTAGGQIIKDGDKVFFSANASADVTVKATHASYQSDDVTGNKVILVDGSAPTLTVSPTVLTTLYTDQTQQFTAMGLWPDGMQASITNNIRWASNNANVANFLGDTTSQLLSQRADGLLTGVAQGTGSITASCHDQSETVAVSVQTLTPVAIKIYRDNVEVENPPLYQVSNGNTISFKAMLVYNADVPYKDVTLDCEWSTDNPQALDVGNSATDSSSDSGLQDWQRRGNVRPQQVNTTPWLYVRYAKNLAEGDALTDELQLIVK